MTDRFEKMACLLLLLPIFINPISAQGEISPIHRSRINIDSVFVERADSFLQFPVRGLSSNLTPYEDSSNQLHPDIVYDSMGWPQGDSQVAPRKYWIAVTPMVSSEKDENPHLFASDDGMEWTHYIGRDSSDSIRNPIFNPRDFRLDTAYIYRDGSYQTFYDTTDGNHDSVRLDIRARHLSDGDILISHDKTLWMFFRVSFSIGAIDMSALFVSSTTNGLEWSIPNQITHVGRFVSPAVVQESDGRFTMYTTIQKDSISGITDNKCVYRFQSEKPDTIWEFVDQVELPIFHGFPWHIDVLPRDDNELIMIINSKQRAALWFATSYNKGRDWIMAKRPFMAGRGDKSTWDAILYRASGYWVSNNNCPIMGLYYSAYCLKGDPEKTIWHTGFAKIRFPYNTE